jgi:quercetin dioxygenase-like cupin family protein
MLKELHLPEPDPDNWVTLGKTGGIRVNTLWENEETGATIALLDIPEGAGIPIRHSHASNQFMYCLEGEYEYMEPESLVLREGSFYMNPKDNPHGPTRANRRTLVLEIYDGPHYYDLPPYHTKETVGRLVDKQA